jgi:hypothetical protein
MSTMASDARLDWEVDLVGIDYATRQAIIGLTLSARALLPERVWVWAYYFNPNFGPESSWSDEPKEVVGPFDIGNRVQFAVGMDCTWCTNPLLPPSGYFARVNVSAEDARVPTSRRRYDPEGRPVPVTGTRLRDTISDVADRVRPAAVSFEGIRSVDELEMSGLIRSYAFERGEVRRLAGGELNYEYRSSSRPGLLLEISFRDGAFTSTALLFEVGRGLDSSDYELISKLFSTVRPGAQVGDDVLEYIRVTVRDDLTRELPAPPYAFSDLLVEANTPLGAPIVSLKRPT